VGWGAPLSSRTLGIREGFQLRLLSGTESEDVVERICTRMFFSDFVVRNPEYRKPKGKKIELADIIVPFGNNLLAFQVKSKFQPTKATEKSEIDFQRITDSINEAVNQTKTINRALRNNWLRRMKTSKGLEIDIDPTKIEAVIGIVVLDLVGEELLSREEQTQLFSSFTIRHGLPIHVFLAHEFYEISSELDTLPDFLRFLDVIQSLYTQDLFIFPPSVLDLLAFYKMDPDKIDRVISDEIRIHIEDGFWEAYHRDHADAIAERDRLNEPSYLIDGIIDYLHTSVGYEALPKDHELAKISGQGSIDGYLTLAREIASLSRLERRSLGERLMRCLQDSMKKAQAFSILYVKERRLGYLVLAKSGDRTERQVFLHRLTAMAYCYLGLDKTIGIATEPISGEGRSYDVLGFSGVEFENSNELAEAAKSFFGEPYSVGGSEYSQSSIPDA